MFNLTLMAAAAAPQGGTEAATAAAGPLAGLGGFLPIILVFILFYVLFIVPQKKQQKKQAELLNSLKKGDKIMTTGGMFGTISDIKETEGTVIIKFSDNVRIEMQRSSISGLRSTTAVQEKK